MDHTATNVSWEMRPLRSTSSLHRARHQRRYAFSVTTGQWHEAGENGKKIDNAMLQQGSLACQRQADLH